MASKFQQGLENGEFVITAEVGPPKGTQIDKLKEDIELLNGKVHGLNVTDNQSSVMRISSLAICELIKKMGGDPILQMTCRDRNRIGLQADLLGASVLGIDDVLCLTGDYITVGDHPTGMPVFDLDSVLLLETIKAMNAGKDIAGNKMNGPTNFYAGAVVTPEADPIEPQLLKFDKKVKAGAKFFQTQAIYDLDNFKKFMKYARKFEGVKIMAGIVLLVSTGMARYMNNNVPGIFVPDDLIAEMKDAGKGKGKGLQAGIEIAGRHIKQLKEENICDGVHIMAIGKEEVVPDILKIAGLM
jgi:5,10-methylenetetrahydrofolate reductase